MQLKRRDNRSMVAGGVVVWEAFEIVVVEFANCTGVAGRGAEATCLG
jgi:hypothetical protein